MGDWYAIGLCAGIGVAAGVLASGVLAGPRRALPAILALGVAAGIVTGSLVDNWDEAVAGAVGGLAGAACAPVVSGALRRGGTRLGTALLVGLGALALAALALVPVVGYLEVVALPALALRMRGRAGERYAGLRSLAK